jgi:hypothetical protein
LTVVTKAQLEALAEAPLDFTSEAGLRNWLAAIG